MKSVIRGIALFICIIIFSSVLVSCDTTNNVKKKYVGEWEINKIVTGSTTVEFGKMIGSVLLMEMSIRFNDDNTYIIHYYVNGKEGDKYPQTGTFSVEGESLIMSNGGIASISEEGLLIEINGSYQYCTRKS